MSWYNPVTWFFGEDTDTYAANVAAQWRTLTSVAETADPEAYARAYNLMVSYYGPPASTEAQILENARKQYMAGINKAADEGFIEGVKSAPGVITEAVVGTFGDVWGKIPVWVRWLGIAALVVAAVHVLTKGTDSLGRLLAARDDGETNAFRREKRKK